MEPIPFNKPCLIGKEQTYILDAIVNQRALCGNGYYTKKCTAIMEKAYGTKKALLTTSCTAALEMASILLDLQPGDEVITPSYTFVSTVNAFVLRGAKPVFVDIRRDTMNIDENLIEAAITPKTKAIFVVHYAGVAAEMDTIMALAKKHNLYVVEDAAQAVDSTYKGRALGAIGHLAAYSFHETKNYTCGEGGALLINDERFIERAEIILEKGTNRKKFIDGLVDKYSWVDIGSSFVLSELNAAYLYAQLEHKADILQKRLSIFKHYADGLKSLEKKGVHLPVVPQECTQNGHMFYIVLESKQQRSALIKYLKEKNIMAVFHYIPLHSAEMGVRSAGKLYNLPVSDYISERLLRLPFYYDLTDAEQQSVIQAVCDFFKA